MRLPYLENALVEERKVTGYLLSDELSEGKAAFFSAFGFALTRWDLLRDALLAHAASFEVAKEISSPYGTKYLIERPLHSPDGRDPQIRAVWIIEAGTVAPRLGTAYALKR